MRCRFRRYTLATRRSAPSTAWSSCRPAALTIALCGSPAVACWSPLPENPPGPGSFVWDCPSRTSTSPCTALRDIMLSCVSDLQSSSFICATPVSSPSFLLLDDRSPKPVKCMYMSYSLLRFRVNVAADCVVFCISPFVVVCVAPAWRSDLRRRRGRRLPCPVDPVAAAKVCGKWADDAKCVRWLLIRVRRRSFC